MYTASPKLSAAQIIEREESLRGQRRISSKFVPNSSKTSLDVFEIVKNITHFFNTDKASGGWFGYSEKHGWLIETGGSTSGLVFKCLSTNTSLSVSYNELRGSQYMKVVDYLNSVQDLSELQQVCMSLVSIIEKIPISSVKHSLSNIVKNANLSDPNRNSAAGKAKIAFSEADLIALASSKGGAHLDNRHKGGVLKIALQKADIELEKLLQQAGFKEITDKPLVFWKK